MRVPIHIIIIVFYNQGHNQTKSRKKTTFPYLPLPCCTCLYYFPPSLPLECYPGKRFACLYFRREIKSNTQGSQMSYKSYIWENVINVIYCEFCYINHFISVFHTFNFFISVFHTCNFHYARLYD